MRKTFVGVVVIVGLLVATSIQSLAQDDLLDFCMHNQTGSVRLDTECTNAETPYYLPSENIVQSLIPTGTIVMWSGAIEDIPEGWALCDGTEATPDLTGKFIVGADDGTTYAVGEEGGSDEVTLAIANMPTHNHNLSGSISSSGSHSHGKGTLDTASVSDHNHSDGSYATVGTGSHSHSYYDCQYSGTEGVGAGLGWYAADNVKWCPQKSTFTTGYHFHNITGYSGSKGGHDHYFSGSTSTEPTHNHSLSGSTNYSGSSDAIDIRPTYYALAYIMKLPPPE